MDGWGIEPQASRMQIERSTTELHAPLGRKAKYKFGKHNMQYTENVWDWKFNLVERDGAVVSAATSQREGTWIKPIRCIIYSFERA